MGKKHPNKNFINATTRCATTQHYNIFKQKVEKPFPCKMRITILALVLTLSISSAMPFQEEDEDAQLNRRELIKDLGYLIDAAAEAELEERSPQEDDFEENVHKPRPVYASAPKCRKRGESCSWNCCSGLTCKGCGGYQGRPENRCGYTCQ